MKSTTPRTDKIWERWANDEAETDDLIDFAKNLETELNQWKECAEKFYSASACRCADRGRVGCDKFFSALNKLNRLKATKNDGNNTKKPC